jgi:hypothetical protein
LIVYSDPGVRHSFAQLFGNTHDNAFHALCCNPYSGEIRDGSRGEAGAIMKPENLAIALLIRSSNTGIQEACNFVDKNCALDGLWTPGGVLAGDGDKIILNLFQVACPALLGVGGLEVITNDVRGHYLHVAGKGVWVLLLEAAEDTKVVGAELKISFLDKIVDRLF